MGGNRFPGPGALPCLPDRQRLDAGTWLAPGTYLVKHALPPPRTNAASDGPVLRKGVGIGVEVGLPRNIKRTADNHSRDAMFARHLISFTGPEVYGMFATRTAPLLLYWLFFYRRAMASGRLVFFFPGGRSPLFRPH